MSVRREATVATLIALLFAPLGCEEGRTASVEASPTGSAEASPTGSPATTSSRAGPSVPWPALPDNQVTLGALVDHATRRSVTEIPELTGPRLLQALERSIRDGALAGGWSAIVDTLTRTIETSSQRGKRTWLLIGSHHDAPDQVDAFRRLVGPLGLSPAPLAAVEQLQGDGGWAGLAEAAQRGDDAMIARYLEDGDPEVLATLRAQQRERNYTAWKYAYVERIVDVVVGARASGRPLVGCDMPGAMQIRLAETVGDEASILRDLHCALSVERHLAASPRAAVALFIGDAHLGATRLPRFIPSTDVVVRVHLLGGRDGGRTLEGLEALRVVEPVLVPLGRRRYALVLDGAPHGARVDRVRMKDAARSGREPQIRVIGAEGRIRLGLDEVTLDDAAWSRPQPPGPVGFLLETGSGEARRLVTGTLDVPPGGGITLDLQEPDVVRIERREP